jgi:hypothetical protein
LMMKLESSLVLTETATYSVEIEYAD